MLQGRFRQQITGQLFERELVVRLSRIQRRNQSITPPPHLTMSVHVIAVRVGVTGQIEPTDCHLFAVTRRSDEPLDQTLVGILGPVRQEAIQLVQGRRQAGQGQRGTPHETLRIRGRCRRHLLLALLLQNEAIQRISYPVVCFELGNRRPPQRAERPWRFALSPGDFTSKNTKPNQQDRSANDVQGWHRTLHGKMFR